MSEYKTPGVYVVEKNAFPNSVVEVATAIPAFIGFTQKAEDGSRSLLNVPFRISSMVEYEEHFGGASSMGFELIDKNNGLRLLEIAKKKAEDSNQPVKEIEAQIAALKAKNVDLVLGEAKCVFNLSGSIYTLYEHVKLFFANGGGACYIVSVGGYKDNLTKDAFKNGIKPLEKEQEPTLLIIPEAVNLKEDDCHEVCKEMLAHCGKMKNRFAILDVYDGYKDRKHALGDVVAGFRTKIGSSFLNFGSVYYPWVNASVLNLNTVGRSNLIIKQEEKVIEKFIHIIYGAKSWGTDETFINNVCRCELHYEYWLIQEDNRIEAKDKPTSMDEACYIIGKNDPITISAAKKITKPTEKEKIIEAAKTTLTELTNDEKNSILDTWWKESKDTKLILKALCKRMNLLPPSAAMAGLYAMVDNTRGVWKAPANVSLNSVVSLPIDITDDEQQDLNISNDGKSINAIRSFVGSGIKVWGARTLDGNNADLKYINVRRTMIFLEESIKNAARSYVFEPNDGNTWLNMKCMIENFLRDVWKRGGLAGTSPEDAFSVHVGLGDTMTSDDILKGIMRITVMVAISHPAEFIEITFQQQMQKS